MTASVGTLIDGLCRSLDDPGEIIGAGGGPDLALFHAANSICSQKVRTVLAHHRIGYVSHPLNIFAGQTYLPDHVRLRMIGCDQAGLPLVAGHSGSTAASSTGCDPAVVPTLVDLRTNEVVVDSKRICFLLDDRVADDRRLRPIALRDAIDAELEIVDDLPNYQMLAGRPAGADLRPEKLKAIDGIDFAAGKVRRCDDYLAEFATDPALAAAYGAKRAKELDAAGTLFSNEAVQRAHDRVEAACARLDVRLRSHADAWLFGQAVTMADLFWAVELLRIDNLGAGHFWAGGRLPAVESFVAKARQLPAIGEAVLHWPGTMF